MFNHWTASRGQISSHSSAIGIESNPNPSTCTAADASPLHCWYTGHRTQEAETCTYTAVCAPFRSTLLMTSYIFRYL